MFQFALSVSFIILGSDCSGYLIRKLEIRILQSNFSAELHVIRSEQSLYADVLWCGFAPVML